MPALQKSQPSSPFDQDSCFQSSSRYSQLKCGQNKTNMESFDEVFRSLSPIFSAIPDTRVFTKEVYPPGIWDIGVLNQLTSFISSNQIFKCPPIKFLCFIQSNLHLHIPTGDVPVAAVLPGTAEHQVVPQVEPQVVRHRPEDVRHQSGMFLLFNVIYWEDLASSGVPSNCERLNSISRPIRVIKSSSSSPF